ncbi:MAG: ferrous iron transport protein A [Verrucomicrobiota bacterium]|nr:ferrous iron transport protein A [Verrucomicrobiota bacterium]
MSSPRLLANPTRQRFSLSQAGVGERLRIVDLKRDCPTAARLRELGFCESAEVCKVADRGACICLLMGMRVAIGQELAAHVYVERVAGR